MTRVYGEALLGSGSFYGNVLVMCRIYAARLSLRQNSALIIYLRHIMFVKNMAALWGKRTAEINEEGSLKASLIQRG